MDFVIQRFEWDTTASPSLNVQRILLETGVSRELAKIESGFQPVSGFGKAPRVVNGVPEPMPKGTRHVIENATVLSALNAVAASHTTAFWWYEERTCNGKAKYTYFAR
jgi:hypothetical protein